MKNKRIDLSCDECKTLNKGMLSGVCSHVLTDMTDNKTCTMYKKGQVLFHEGTRPLGVFCINQGMVKVYKTGMDGKEQIIQLAKEGDLLGYRSMIGEELYPVSAETLSEASVCFIPKTDFLNALNNDPDFNQKLLKAVCKELGVMAESITNIAQRSVRERLAITLLLLKDTYGTEPSNDGPVEINLTREDMANMVGTATETLIRLLHDFKEEKLIETNGRKIKVLNSKALVKVANLA